MVTGDNKITAANIAEQVGITSQSDGKGRILEASELMKLFEDRGLLKDEAPKLDANGKPAAGSANNLKKIVMNSEADEKAF